MQARVSHKPSTKSKATAPHVPHAPTPARLLLRVHSAKQLHLGAFSQGVYCKMYVGETAMFNGSDKSLFSKMTGGHAHHDADVHTHKDGAGDIVTHRIFRTHTVALPPSAVANESVALWDENFDVQVPDTANDILSIRVKSQHRLYPSVVGVCAIPLKQLRLGHSVDRWVALLKGSREVGSLRLQLVLSPIHNPEKLAERSKYDLQADIKTALAANQSADEAIERLLTSATFSNSNRGGAVVLQDADTDENQNQQGSKPHDTSSLKQAAIASKEHAAVQPTAAFSA